METLFGRLKEWRRSTASLLEVPPYFVLSNAHLAGIALAAPSTQEELAQCPGMGPKKLAQFGTALLTLVAQGLAEGLEPGVVPPPVPEAKPQAEPDPVEILSATRREMAKFVAKRLKGRFSPGQIESVLATWVPFPQQEARN